MMPDAVVACDAMDGDAVDGVAHETCHDAVHPSPAAVTLSCQSLA
jgi:hypothetical protein